MAKRRPKRRLTPLQRARSQAQLLEHKLKAAQIKAALSYYASADKGRKNRDWKAQQSSADLAIIPDAEVITPRARQMVANTWLGKAAVRSQRRNVVGRGIMCIPVAKDVKGRELSDLNLRAGEGFLRWASSFKHCDIERKRTFWQIQRMIVGEEFIAGESFVVWSYVPNLTVDGRIDLSQPTGLRLQVFESEQLDLRLNNWNGNEVRGGVETDENGAPVAYHFYARNPNDYLVSTNWQTVRIPAERVFHYYDAERVMQTRGVSQLAPIMQDMRDNARHRDAHLWRAIMEACIGMVITKSQPTASGNPLTMARAAGDIGTTPSGMRTTDFVPGMVPELAPGEDIKPFIPTTPGNGYEAFTTQIIRGIGAGMGMSYGALTRHNDANYSAARQDMLEDAREIEPQQDALIDHVILPVYELWFHLSNAEGRFPEINEAEMLAYPDNYLDAEYIAPARPWIDPEKEINAFAKGLELRIVSRKEIVAQRGGRLQNLLRQIKEEREQAKALGIDFPEDVVDTSGNTDPMPLPDEIDGGEAAGVELAQIDAPNYRPKNDPVFRCSTCKHLKDGRCAAYDFSATPSSVCDSWEASPPAQITNRKILPPGIQSGERGVDRDFQPTASTVRPI